MYHYFPYHLQKLTHFCAFWIVDTISVDHRNKATEEFTQRKLELLAKAYKTSPIAQAIKGECL
jgi:hypothetical protein